MCVYVGVVLIYLHISLISALCLSGLDRLKEARFVPRDCRKCEHTKSTNERKIEEGIHQESKNDTEIRI